MQEQEPAGLRALVLSGTYRAMTEDIRGIASVITEIVAQGPLTGAGLSAALKLRMPGFRPSDHGARNLRDFIAAHVEDVIVAGRSGMDVVYVLRGARAPELNHDAEPEIDFWRIWVSPNSPHALAIDRVGAGIRGISRSQSVLDTEVLLQPMSVDCHRQVAHEFLSSVPLDARSTLQASVDLSGDDWWHAWLRQIRAAGLLSRWNLFRRERFEDLLIVALRGLGLESQAVEQAFDIIKTRRAPVATDAVPLRRFVIEAVQRMSVDELRELRLPVGVLFDIFGAPRFDK